MPIYEYACTNCDHRADILHGINDPGPNFCPSCGSDGTMRKQFALPTIHFKGSGWAKKDRGGSSRGTRAANRSGSSEGSKDGKPAGEGSDSSGSSSSGSSSSSSDASSGSSGSDSSASSGPSKD
jgi:putative FmdB family regulatory protein